MRTITNLEKALDPRSVLHSLSKGRCTADSGSFTSDRIDITSVEWQQLYGAIWRPCPLCWPDETSEP